MVGPIHTPKTLFCKRHSFAATLSVEGATLQRHFGPTLINCVGKALKAVDSMGGML
jgi:hypothetical protein